MTVHQETDFESEYMALFKGAISLQIYSKDDFADRISGVMLDSFSAGSPIITISGTWMARIAEEFKAGIALETTHPAEIYRAAISLSENYIYYRENALNAGLELQKRHNPGHLLQVLIS